MIPFPAGKSADDIIYMRRCLQLAANAAQTAAPNPMVGAVVVHQGRIIGEGWHRQAGQPHAEPNAIASVKDPSLLRESTLYVSLEPCSHYGKTPPCADLIIQKGIPRVVVGCLDPFPEVSGRGVQRLREAGIDVRVGVEETACQLMNRRFFRFHLSHRPYVTLKWAQTADGFLDRTRRPGDGVPPLPVSDAYTSMLVHRLRSQCDAVLVGASTFRLDRPRLDVRHWPAFRQPVRVVLQRDGAVACEPPAGTDTAETWIYNDSIGRAEGKCRWIPLYRLDQVLADLHGRGVQHLLVEGGRQVLESFLQAGLWDEIQVETNPTFINNGVRAPQLPEAEANWLIFNTETAASHHRISTWLRPVGTKIS